MGLPTLQETLSELEGTLEDERQALRTLRRAEIDQAAARKVALEQRLREFAASKASLGAAERKSLERVRRAAQRNMMLLIHARACVRGALAAVRGSFEGAYPTQRALAVAPLRLDVRR
jgi:beta-glucosidase-like glycosyl hydrolase